MGSLVITHSQHTEGSRVQLDAPIYMKHAAEKKKPTRTGSISLCWQGVPAHGMGAREVSLLLQYECISTSGGL